MQTIKSQYPKGNNPMNFSGYIIRAIIAVVVCFIAVALFHAALAAFTVAPFTPAIVRFLDLCIYALGVLYVFFGTHWNQPNQLT